jgi:hypothetical protein
VRDDNTPWIDERVIFQIAASGIAWLLGYGFSLRSGDLPHQNATTRSTSNHDISATIEGLEAALKSLELSDSINYNKTAKEFNVSATTLRRRHKGEQQSRSDVDFTYKSRLSKQQETDLIAYINKLSGRGLPPTVSMVKNFADELAKSPIGKNWVYEFVQHDDELVSE